MNWDKGLCFLEARFRHDCAELPGCFHPGMAVRRKEARMVSSVQEEQILKMIQMEF